jgi:hypothetical protein
VWVLSKPKITEVIWPGRGLNPGLEAEHRFDSLCPGGAAQWTSHPSQEQKTQVRTPPGASPTIVSYNASAVEIFNAANSIARF